MTDFDLLIEGVGRRGEGVARHDGRTLFVPLTLPGETVRAAGDGDRLQLVDLISPSPERIAPFCKYYGVCGGCQLQHWDEMAYRAWKCGLVEQALLARGITTTVSELIDAHGAGRRRVSIHARRRDKTVTAGFMAARSHDLLNIDQCPILAKPLERAFDIARRIAEKLGDCDVALTATLTGLDVSVKAERKIVEREHAKLAALATELKLARLSVNGDQIVTAAMPRLVMGRVSSNLPPGCFVQATGAGEEALARLVLAGVAKARTIADLFCGVGPFALRMAERARVEAYDSDKPMICSINAAAKATPGLKPLIASARDLFREPLVANEMKGFDAVVIDPPRAGAEAQMKQLARSKVKTVVSVSCDVASFARDAEILIGGGYALTALTAVDQFKYSSHVEIVGVFRR